MCYKNTITQRVQEFKVAKKNKILNYLIKANSSPWRYKNFTDNLFFYLN